MPSVNPPEAKRAHSSLIAVRAVHTLAWAFFAGCIFAIPVAAWNNRFALATWLAAIVAVEVCVLVLNRFQCPLTAVAARYTDDRQPNFDIWLPMWLAKHNQRIFGFLYFAGIAFTVVRWFQFRQA